MNKYIEQAENFLKDCGAKITIEYVGMGANKNWGETTLRPKYQFTITTPLGKMTETFWDSIANKEKLENGKYDGPNAYDILACLGGDSYVSGDFDEFCSEYGYDNEPGSERTKARKIWKLCLKQNEKLRRCFTEEQIEEMRDTIQ